MKYFKIMYISLVKVPLSPHIMLAVASITEGNAKCDPVPLRAGSNGYATF